MGVENMGSAGDGDVISFSQITREGLLDRGERLLVHRPKKMGDRGTFREALQRLAVLRRDEYVLVLVREERLEIKFYPDKVEFHAAEANLADLPPDITTWYARGY